MLLRVDVRSRIATRVGGEHLKLFGLDERGLQDILFRSLDRLLPVICSGYFLDFSCGFRGTMFSMDADSGSALVGFLQDRRQT